MRGSHGHRRASWKGVVLAVPVIDYGYFRRNSGHACDDSRMATKAFLNYGSKVWKMLNLAKVDGLVQIRKCGNQFVSQLFELVGIGQKLVDCR